MSTPLTVTRDRLQRLVDERGRAENTVADIRRIAEEGQRDLGEGEQEQVEAHRSRIASLDQEIEVLTEDLERSQNTRDVSELLRVTERQQSPPLDGSGDSPSQVPVYRSFAQYARDALIVRFPNIAAAASGNVGPTVENTVREQANERLERALQNTLTSDLAGLVVPTHVAQIMDIINTSRPVVQSSRQLNLTSGKLTYPKIKTRPVVAEQSSEKTQAGSTKMEVELGELPAKTYLGAGDLSWQAINWSTPDALQLWFQLMAEAYARQTETAACGTLEAAALGTASSALGTAGTEDFADWRASIMAGLGDIYSTTGGRANTNTLWVSAARFFSLAGLGTNETLQVSPVGNLDVGAMTGTFSGLRVVGSYGFADSDTAILGDSGAFLTGENAGAPVEMRAVEPAIGGLEVGVIGAFAATVFDEDRFIRLS